MARRNLGVAGEVKLAEMAALPPFAQMFTDMDRAWPGGGRGKLLRAHGEKLPRRFSAFHYLTGNRIGYAAGSSSEQEEMNHVDPIPPRSRFRRAHLAAQRGHARAGALAQHAGAAGLLDRRLCLRPGSGGRNPRRPDAVSGAVDAQIAGSAAAVVTIREQRRGMIRRPARPGPPDRWAAALAV